MRIPLHLFVGLAMMISMSHLEAQPIITQQPTNQFVFVGNPASVSITVSGTAPFTYQWQLSGTNLPPAASIMTMAGSGIGSYFGDGGVATNAALYAPFGIAVNSSGNLFIADSSNSRIRKIDTNGIITTVAGNGTGSYSGDGGVATNATLNYPFGVTVDVLGNVFIAEWGNNRIRKVNTNGIITTVAGKGTQGYSGDGGAATNAVLNAPIGVAVDTIGNLFFSDSSHRIRKVFTNGVITTVAGNGTNSFSGDGGAAINAGLSTPQGIALDSRGDLYIADINNQRIRKVDTNGIISTVAGGWNQIYGDGGAATDALLPSPVGVAVDAGGNLFIADYNNRRIRKVDTNGIITTVAGNGTASFYGDGGAATKAALNSPTGVAVDAGGNIFIADQGNNRIRKVISQSYSSMPSLIFGSVSASDAGYYSVIITNLDGSVTSSSAALSVILSPTSRTNGASSTATFTATVFSPETLSFQWLKNGTNLTDGSNISGAINSTLTVANVQDADAAIYSAVVSDAAASVTTSNAVLTVNDTLLFATQPQSQTNLIGSSVFFNAIAYGVPPFVFQWYFNNSPVGSPTSGTNYSAYTVTNVGTNQAGIYTVQVVNGSGNVMSSNAVLTVAVPPIITTQPLSRTNNANTTAAFSVTATSVLPLSYQWQQNSTNLINGGKFSGATNSTLTINTVSSNEAAIYSVIVTNLAGSATSSNAALTVNYLPSIAVQPSGALVLPGTNVAFGITLNGTAPFNYSWRFNGTNILNATNGIYTISSVLTNNAGNYSVVITNVAGSVTSFVAALTVLVSPTNLVKNATSNATFTVIAFNPVSLVYKWQQNGTNLVNGGKFSGVTGNTLTITGVSSNEAAVYAVTVTNTVGNVTSSNATLTVNYPPVFTAQPLSQRVVFGNGVAFNVAVSGTAPFNYQWRFNAGNLLNATNPIYAIQAVGTNNTGIYSVVVTNVAGSVTSSNALLVVLVPPSLALQFSAGYPLLYLNGMLSNTFVVQYNTDLTTTNWITLQAFSNLLTSPYPFLDPTGVGQTSRFYRVFMQ